MEITLKIKLKKSTPPAHVEVICRTLERLAFALKWVTRATCTSNLEAREDPPSDPADEVELIDESALKLKLRDGRKLRLSDREGSLLYFFMHIQPLVRGGDQLLASLQASAPLFWGGATADAARSTYSRLAKKLRDTEFPLVERPSIYGALRAFKGFAN